jgi:hypothetical protein
MLREDARCAVRSARDAVAATPAIAEVGQSLAAQLRSRSRTSRTASAAAPPGEEDEGADELASGGGRAGHRVSHPSGGGDLQAASTSRDGRPGAGKAQRSTGSYGGAGVLVGAGAPSHTSAASAGASRRSKSNNGMTNHDGRAVDRAAFDLEHGLELGTKVGLSFIFHAFLFTLGMWKPSFGVELGTKARRAGARATRRRRRTHACAPSWAAARATRAMLSRARGV